MSCLGDIYLWYNSISGSTNIPTITHTHTHTHADFHPKKTRTHAFKHKNNLSNNTWNLWAGIATGEWTLKKVKKYSKTWFMCAYSTVHSCNCTPSQVKITTSALHWFLLDLCVWVNVIKTRLSTFHLSLERLTNVDNNLMTCWLINHSP